MLRLCRILMCLGVLVLTCHAAQADFVVVPNAQTFAEGDWRQFAMFRSGGETFQWVLGANQLAAIPVGSQITSIGFRLDGLEPDQPTVPITFNDYIIQVGTPAQPFSSVSSTFTANLGPDTVQVRSGPLALAANSLMGGLGPNPFYDIPFDLPYSYGGRDILITLRHTGAGTGNGIPVDAVTLPNDAGNTVGEISFDAATGTVSFYNLPVTRFGFRPFLQAVPESSAAYMLAIGTLLALIFGWLRRVRAKQ